LISKKVEDKIFNWVQSTYFNWVQCTYFIVHLNVKQVLLYGPTLCCKAR
jgi:hypothetical protein